MVTEIDTTDNPGADAVCRVTGLPVVRRPEWTRVQLDENYSASIEVIGGHILHSKPVGYATPAGVAEVNRLHLEAIEQVEQALSDYAGTVVVISHDRRFVEHLAPTRTIDLG